MPTVADIDWVVISLKRTPERLTQFMTINGHLHLPFETMEAVDGLDLDREELARSGLTVPQLDWRPGALGAAMSHRQCWLRVVESGRPMCILEDDIYMRRDFVQQANRLLAGLPEDWDHVQFGFNTDAVLDLQPLQGLNVRGPLSHHFPTVEQCEQFTRSSGDPILMPLHMAFGNSCYVVSSRGAQKLLDGVFPLSRREVLVVALPAVLVALSKDVLMNELYRDMAAFISIPPLALPANDKQVSTVWVD